MDASAVLSMNTPINWSDWIIQTRQIEDAIWARREAFEKRFCQGEELLSTGLSSESLKIVYLLPEGQHITNSFPLAELMGFLEETPIP